MEKENKLENTNQACECHADEEHECCCHEHDHDHADEHKCCCHDQEHHHDHDDDDDHECCCHDQKHHHDDCDDDDDDGCGCGCCHNHDSDGDEKKERIILICRALVTIILLVASFFVGNIASMILLIIAYLVISYDVLYRAIRNIFKKNFFDEHFLMSIASLTALVVSFVSPNSGIDAFDGVLVILLYQIGEFIQDLAVDKSRHSITDMMKLDVDKVIKIEDGKEIEIDANAIKENDILVIKPGETIPVDGIIVKGSSTINTSSLTGESKPLDVYENDKVLSSCINNDGLIHIQALTTFSNSTSAKVMKVIKDASKNKAKSEKFITKFAKYYTPIVIIISLIVMFILPLILGFKDNFMTYLYKGLAIMVISCPCALVISIPLSYFMGIGRSAKNAILVKGSSYLEILSKIDVVAFDKTGTLTKGSFSVTKVKSKDEILMSELLYSCEKNFTHPIAISITKYYQDKVKEVNIENLKNIPGYGLKCLYNDKEVIIGNEKLLKENKISFESITNNKTIVYVAYDNNYLGYVIIEDTLKDDAIESINELNKKYEVALISGDNKQIVEDVANNLNIKKYYYETLPEDKVNVIDSLKTDKKVVYVGDGINDAACLLKADVGIAMKSLGSDIAISASDIVVMDDKISSINKSIGISKKTMKIVVENIVFSISIKVLIMILTMFIYLPMWVAIIADVGVCLIAILNSLRIMYGKIKN